MKSNTPKHIRDLVAKIQRQEPGIFLDITTGSVYRSNEFNSDDYLGTIPRKLIPNRKKLERDHMNRIQEISENYSRDLEADLEKNVISVDDLIRNGLPTNAVGPCIYSLRNQGYRVID